MVLILRSRVRKATEPIRTKFTFFYMSMLLLVSGNTPLAYITRVDNVSGSKFNTDVILYCTHKNVFYVFSGVGFMQRKMMVSFSPPMVIEQDGDSYAIKVITPVRTNEFKFKLGDEFDHVSMSGKSCKVWNH